MSDASVVHLSPTRELTTVNSVSALDAGGVPTGLWLQPTGAPGGVRQGWLQGTVIGLAYELFGATSLPGPWKLETRFNGLAGQTAYELAADARPSLFLVAASISDTDGDGLSDEYERRVSLTSATSADTDLDGMPDGWEVENNLNPRMATDDTGDPDKDGFPNELEYRLGRNPNIAEGVPEVTVSASASSIDEGSAGTQFIIKRGSPRDREMEVVFELTGRAVNGSDYQPIAGTITFPAGASQMTVPVRPIDDTQDEPGEPITLELVPGADYQLGTVRTATINLIDNDLPVVSISATDPDAREPWMGWADTGEFEVRREGMISQSLTVLLKRGGTSVYGTDDLGIPASVLIPAGEVAVRFKVTPKNNGVSTGSRTLNAEIDKSSTAYSVAAGANLATVTIQDAQPPVVTVTASDPEAAEKNNTGTFKFTRTGGTSKALNVRYRVGGTATARPGTYSRADYPVLPGMITIPAGKSEETLTFQPYDDVFSETLETVNVALGGSPDYTIGTAAEATVTVDDDEPFTFSSQTLCAVSGRTTGPFAQIEVIRGGSAAAALTVPVEVRGRRLWNGVWYDFKNVPAAAGASYGLYVDGQPAAAVTFPKGVFRRMVTLKSMHPVSAVPNAVVVLTPPGGGLPQEHPIQFLDPDDYITMTASATDVTEGAPWRVILTPASATSADGTTVRLSVGGEASLSEYTVSGAAQSGNDLVVSIPPVVSGTVNRQVVVTFTPKADGVAEPVSEHLVVRFNQTQTGVGLTVDQQAKPYVAVRIRDSGSQPVLPLDVDADGFPDDYETANGMDPLVPSESLKDTDRDGIGDRQELLQGTRYDLADTDGDGLTDHMEAMLALNPMVKDSQNVPPQQDLVPVRLRTAGAFREDIGECYRCHAPGMKVGGIELASSTADGGAEGKGVLERLVFMRAGTSHTIQLVKPVNFSPTGKQEIYDAEILPAATGIPPGFLIEDDALPILGRSRIYDDKTFERTAKVRVLSRPRLGVDANRDGDLQFGGSDATSSARPFRFWVNNDSDVGVYETIDGTPDHPGGKIQGVRDVEDFTRLWIALDGMNDLWAKPGYRLALEWRTVSTGEPAIQLYSAAAWDTGYRQYLETEDGAKSQAGMFIPGYEVAIRDETSGQYTLKPGMRLVFPSSAMKDRVSNSRRHLVFEGAGTGQGTLVAMLLKDGVVLTESEPLHLRLMDVKQMFQRAQATPTDGFLPPYEYEWTQPPTRVTGVAAWPLGFNFDPDPDETTSAAIFVHGWNMTEKESANFAETLFKRLWQVGYKGRFCAFRWPTYTYSSPGILDSFNASEYRAWEYGNALKNFVESLPLNYTRNILAHSMGGIVTTSALRSKMSVQNVIMMQAAISAGVFDEDPLLNWPRLILTERDAATGLKTPDEFSSEGGYRGLLAQTGCKVFNYFNEFDYALQTGNYGGAIEINWIANQVIQKPHWPGWSRPSQYTWNPTGTRDGTDARFRMSHFQRLDFLLRLVPLIHERLSFVARSRTRALGAETAGGLSDFARRDMAGAGIRFSDSRSDHSGQFNRAFYEVWSLFSLFKNDIGGN